MSVPEARGIVPQESERQNLESVRSADQLGEAGETVIVSYSRSCSTPDLLWCRWERQSVKFKYGILVGMPYLEILKVCHRQRKAI